MAQKGSMTGKTGWLLRYKSGEKAFLYMIAHMFYIIK